MQRIVCGLSLMSKSIQATYYKISRGRMSIIVAIKFSRSLTINLLQRVEQQGLTMTIIKRFQRGK